MRCGRVRRIAAVFGAVWLAGVVPAVAYESKLHQQLTFIAAKHFNRCVEGGDALSLSPLQVRYVAKANVAQADTNIFRKMFNWGYYNRDGQAQRGWFWVVDTRLHEHFNELVQRAQRTKDPVRRYRTVGRLLNYIQDVSSPAHAVPVYASRFWRLSFSDRFDGYRLDEETLAAALADACDVLDRPANDYYDVLAEVADDTVAALEQPIAGLPATWESFWKLDKDPGDFGEYGPAGNNFGRDTEFRCDNGQRCVLLKRDPLYERFAMERHRAAVLGTMRTLYLLQLSQQDLSPQEVSRRKEPRAVESAQVAGDPTNREPPQ